MKVTFPHMGHMYVPVKGLLEHIGLEVIVPPKSSKKTMNIGTQLSPEYACLPLKINIGNFVEAHELGADTIIMAGGVGPCRFGYYAQVQREILLDMGLNYEVIVLEPPDTHYSELVEKIKLLSNSWIKVVGGMYLAYTKACAIDRIEKEVQRIRPREIKFGKADEILDKAIGEIDKASVKKDITKAVEKGLSQLSELQIDTDKQVPKIAIVGEIYTVLEPFVNFHLEKLLGKLGVETTRSIYLSQWINDHLFLGLLPSESSRSMLKLSNPYLNSFVGGHGRETIGSSVYYGQLGYDGVIQLAPFTCMPEIVAHSVLSQVSKKYDMPTMSIYLDEQSGEAGLKTRVEAFVDLIKRQTATGGEKNEMLLGY
ncbi:MAG: CoA protein activase [Bacillota bacterium]|nr:CoA protein activase [Bacillota bacterium]